MWREIREKRAKKANTKRDVKTQEEERKKEKGRDVGGADA